MSKRRLARAKRELRDARLVALAAEIGVERAAAELGVSRSHAFEIVRRGAPPVAPGHAWPELPEPTDRPADSASAVQVRALAAVLDAFDAAVVTEALHETARPARTVGRLLDAVAMWGIEATERTDDDQDDDDQDEEEAAG